jgi:hypothetical protein
MKGKTVDLQGNSELVALRNGGRQPHPQRQPRRDAQALSRISPYFVPFAVKNSGQNCSELCPETFHSFHLCGLTLQTRVKTSLPLKTQWQVWPWRDK